MALVNDKISAVTEHTIEREPNFGWPDPLPNNEYGQRTGTNPNGSSSLAATELQRPAAQSVLMFVAGMMEQSTIIRNALQGIVVLLSSITCWISYGGRSHGHLL